MATTQPRIYKGKDSEMLIASSTILGHAINNKTFLVSKRATWADPYFGDLKARIDKAFQDFLGVDNAKDMREATQLVLSLQQTALPKLAEFKIQIVVDFKNPRQKEILTQLGFTTHLKQAQRKDQEALIELLFMFKNNMTTALKTEITDKGTSATLIDDIITFADQLKDSNISQEALKGGRKEISAAGVLEFNAIYEQIIGIAKIAAKFTKDDKAKTQEFSYAKTIKALNFQAKAVEPPKP